MKKMLFTAILPMLAALLLAPSCDPVGNENGDEKPDNTNPEIVILDKADLQANSAVLKISFKAGAPNRVSPTFRCGCIDMGHYAQASGSDGSYIVEVLADNGIEGTVSFGSAPYGTASFSGLEAGTAYISVVVVSYGPINYYSNLFEFSTPEDSDGDEGDEGDGGDGDSPDNSAPDSWEMPPAVDMGLPSGKAWAAFDLGAGTIGAHGKYFAWGETEPKALEKFTWSDYKWCKGSNTTLTKYCQDSRFGYNGYSDSLSSLEAQDDAATVHLNSDWSIPSYQDFIELMDNCDRRKATVNGVWGMIFTSRINGNAIFFPASGSVENGILRAFGKEGVWWCDSFIDFEVINGGPYSAFIAFLPEYMDDVFAPNDVAERCSGALIRPVCSNPSAYPANVNVESVTLNCLADTLAAGEVMTLEVTISPASAALVPVEWESSDPSVASVEYGKVSALSEGTATISAKAGGKTASCTVIVKPSKVSTTQKVDLGLSVKWAGWNIGASAPQEYGKYFAWGETTAWALGWSGLAYYRFYDRSSPSSSPKFTKYVTSLSYATEEQYVDGLSTLLPEDDAATAAWGGKWRMPTDAEKTELLANTTHERYEYQGIKGYLFTSTKNGNAIFLPCTGIMIQGSSPTEEEYLCGFWTSTLKSDNSMACIACNKVSGTGLLPDSGFEMDPKAESWHLGQYRWYGLPVRAVLGE